jgi:N-acetylmuramoyl-L-alanine amidase
VAIAGAVLLTACSSTAAVSPRPTDVSRSSRPAGVVATPSSASVSRAVATGSATSPARPPARATRSASSPSKPVAAAPLVVLDPGHNGGNATDPGYLAHQVYAGFGHYKACNTTGTETDAGYPEHAFTWDVALRVRSLLEAHGVRVLLTRPSDHGVGPCVNDRAKVESTPGTAAAVAIHADGGPSAGRGFHVCYDSRTPEGATAATVSASLRLSRTVHDALARSSGLVESTYLGHGGYFPRDDLAGLNLSTSPTTFLELGNMRNAGDAALQSAPAGRARIAAAVATGILAYLAH